MLPNNKIAHHFLLTFIEKQIPCETLGPVRICLHQTAIKTDSKFAQVAACVNLSILDHYEHCIVIQHKAHG